MSEENTIQETEDMNEEFNKAEEVENTAEDEEQNVAQLPAEEAEEAEEREETQPSFDVPTEPPVIPLKKTNRFFLAALFPLAFVLIMGLVILFEHLAAHLNDGSADLGGIAPADELYERTTEEPYYEIKADEVRGVYIATVHNINFPSSQTLGAAALKAELDGILVKCAENGFNAVYFQVSPMSDALYDSEILPTSSVLTGKEGAPLPEGFDPLAYLCGKAHKAGIAVHAWVNPMRVTAGGHDAEDLAPDNPANEPGYTFTYGGEMYYDLGRPEVRNLQARVCEELVMDYPIDGIVFDDYFYPYPVDGEEINDKYTYELFGGEYDNVADFRRASTTALVGECYDAIKATRPDCQFGVAPFGIWRNDDGKNGGSQTKGSEGYETLYCDALAFIKAGKVDYIAPQLYWAQESTVAPFKELCDWWYRAVKDTDVRLLISHGAYRVGDWEDGGELMEQVEHARTKRAYYGSIFYGYASILNNEYGVADVMAQMYCEKE